jgi:hypothetical protein
MDPEESVDDAMLATARDALIGDFLASRLTAAALVQELARLAPPTPANGLDLSVDLNSDRSVDLTRRFNPRTRARHGA